ncbi:MAG: hypothetical protein WC529_05115 [Candidatus Margulisiibacteriota bacterium]
MTTSVTGSTGGPTQLRSNIGGISLGWIKVGSREVATLAWHPDFKFGAWGAGFDVNLALGDNKPEGYETAVLRYVEYDDFKKGLRYGILDGVTLGHGLIMKNYSTRVGNSVLPVNEQTGIRGYIDLDRNVVRAMATKSNVYYLRLEQRVNPLLTLGGYYVTDSTGRKIVQTDGSTRLFPSVSAVGVDAVMPLPLNLEGYAEAGQLMNHGNGYAAGLSWGYDLMVANASFLAEYRVLDKGFVPAYFSADYENNPVDLASAEASGSTKNGYLAQLGVNALGLASLSLIYEAYQDSNATLTGDLTAKFTDQLTVRGYYKQPNFVDYRSITLEQGAVLGADVAYKLNPYTSLITHYKKSYNPVTGQVEATQYYEIGLSF